MEKMTKTQWIVVIIIFSIITALALTMNWAIDRSFRQIYEQGFLAGEESCK